MRVLPIAFWMQNINDRDLIKKIEDISVLTHAHKRSKLACILYVEFAIQLILGNKKEKALDNTICFITNNCLEEYYEEVVKFKKILNKEIIYSSEDNIKSTGYVIDTLEAVIWSFFNTENYSEAIFKSINLGGDTDTIAAIVGGLAGIYYGFDNIPNAWIQSLANKKFLYDMFKNFSIITIG